MLTIGADFDVFVWYLLDACRTEVGTRSDSTINKQYYSKYEGNNTEGREQKDESEKYAETTKALKQTSYADELVLALRTDNSSLCCLIVRILFSVSIS